MEDRAANRIRNGSNGKREPIAIIGIGCRFAGIDDVESFWRVLRDGNETVGEYPGNRFPAIDTAYVGDSVASRRGGFLRDLDSFDADFFGISAREAAPLDPQQRLLLETAWEAAEDAGIPAEKLAGTRTGVFVGIWTNDYENYTCRPSREIGLHATTGTGRYSASGRLAYFLDLRGPALTVDTACSSSLVAIQLACQSLHHKESEMALAGGANVILRPEITLAYSASGMLAADGRCKFGDASANGYVRSEGAGMILLKPLDRALADGDPVYAVILGGAINNDGRLSGSLVAPSSQGQETMLREAFRDAGVQPEEIDYIEAHGTGTAVGDPAEIVAIGRVMQGRKREHPCLIGSVKTNIGHTESAAGVAGVIKAVLSLQRETIPASLHIEKLNPRIPWDEIPVAVQTRTVHWTGGSHVRRAGVTSFGITGTNAHLVLESIVNPQPNTPRHSTESEPHRLFALSARNPESLQVLARRWRDRLVSEPAWAASLQDLAFTASRRRTHHEFRLAIAANRREDLTERLRLWLEGEPHPAVQSGRRQTVQQRRTVFVFPGQGGQWPGMCQSLYRSMPAFRETLDECDAAVRRCMGWSILDALMKPEALASIAIVQPCLFAAMVALSALWRSYGIKPDAVVGHSMGETAAAAVSGALSLQDAVAVICHRSLLMKRGSGRGAMAATELSLDDAELFIRGYDGRISVAASNSPSSTVLSGDAEAIDDALLKLQAREIFGRRIRVDVASHSAHMDTFCPELVDRLRGIEPQPPVVPFYSTVTGGIEGGMQLDASYWGRNLREPVRFSRTLQKLLADGFNTFIEISPHPVLLDSLESGIGYSGKEAIAVASTRRDQNEQAEMLCALGALYVSGFPVDFPSLCAEGSCLRLPPYPWLRERHWIETGRSEQPSAKTPEEPAVKDCTNDLYELCWKAAPMPVETSGRSGLWLVVGTGEIAAQIVADLQRLGEECIPALNADELRRLLETSGGTCRGVIRAPNAFTADAGEALREASEIIAAVQALIGTVDFGAPRLWLLTTGLWLLPGDEGEIPAAQAPAWGMGRVIAQAHPELAPVNVDLSLRPTPAEIESLAAVLFHDGREEQVALRGRQYFVARHIKRTDTQTALPVGFRPDTTYLITGGLGGIGLKLAAWIAARGGRHIALAARKPPSEDARQRIAAIECAGAKVRVFSADAADESQVRSMLATIGNEMPPLAGVFHLAAQAGETLRQNLEPLGLENAMRAKAGGAWVLHRELHSADLDFFVLFSSSSVVVGQRGLAGYSAANAYVDALSRHRRAIGRPALSVQSSAWSGTGLLNDPAVRHGFRQFENQGIRSVEPEAALEALGRMMGSDAAVVLMLPAEPDTLARSFEEGSLPRSFAGLFPSSIAGSPVASTSIREKLFALEAGSARRLLLENHLREKLAAVLKTSASRIDSENTFGSLGLDSLMALEFVRQLGATTLRLPVTTVFNYSTIGKLSGEIARRMGIAIDPVEQVSAQQRVANVQAPTSVAVDLTEEQAIEALMGSGKKGK